MNPNSASTHSNWTKRLGLVLLAGVLALTTACGHFMMKAPPVSEFGLGPRTSARSLYTATIQPQQPLKTRQLLTFTAMIRDREGHAVDGATIAIDGGMPQHGHGLPTKPRVARNREGGLYDIEGVRFNMGGWWEFTLTVNGEAGPDRVTFNLAL